VFEISPNFNKPIDVHAQQIKHVPATLFPLITRDPQQVLAFPRWSKARVFVGIEQRTADLNGLPCVGLWAQQERRVILSLQQEVMTDARWIILDVQQEVVTDA
jgi:hypothetical protein